MQTRRQSLWEVSLDYVFSILVNVGGQILFYQSLATPIRVSLFALAILGLAYPRRYATRRLFNAMLPPTRQQPRWHSVLEIVSDTLVALVIAYLLQILIYGDAATVWRAGGLSVLAYAFAMVRRYIFRRVFARWETGSPLGQATTTTPARLSPDTSP